MYLKLRFLDEMPYTLLRARCPDVVAAALRDYDKTVAALRAPRRVSWHLCSPAGPLRRELEAHANGAGASERLARELQPLELALLDESVIEGEHRSLRVEGQRAHGVRQPFAARRCDSSKTLPWPKQRTATQRSVPRLSYVGDA